MTRLFRAGRWVFIRLTIVTFSVLLVFGLFELSVRILPFVPVKQPRSEWMSRDAFAVDRKRLSGWKK